MKGIAPGRAPEFLAHALLAPPRFLHADGHEDLADSNVVHLLDHPLKMAIPALRCKTRWRRRGRCSGMDSRVKPENDDREAGLRKSPTALRSTD
jgi:hypothetical protein